jgi:hypothetical protein
MDREWSGEPPLSFEQHHHAGEPAAGTAVDPSEPFPENNDPALVLVELIIALMRRGGLSPEEGYFCCAADDEDLSHRLKSPSPLVTELNRFPEIPYPSEKPPILARREIAFSA